MTTVFHKFLNSFFKNIYLFVCSRSQMQHVGSLAFISACELLVAACRIQFPDQGSNLSPLHWQHGVLATGPQGKSNSHLILDETCVCIHSRSIFIEVPHVLKKNDEYALVGTWEISPLALIKYPNSKNKKLISRIQETHIGLQPSTAQEGSKSHH